MIVVVFYHKFRNRAIMVPVWRQSQKTGTAETLWLLGEGLGESEGFHICDQ